jgi:carboxypeptidase Taq
MFINYSSKDLYQLYAGKMRKIADIKNSMAVLGWDQETYLPPKGAMLRGQQLTTLSTIAHELFTENELGEILNTLTEKNDLDETQRANARLSLEDYTKNKKYPSSFVAALSDAINECYHAWISARRANDFGKYIPSLEKMIRLKKEETNILGYSGSPYDALLNEHEKGATVNMLDKVFADLKEQVIPLIRAIHSKPVHETGFLHQHFDKQSQWEFGIGLLKKMGFDFEAGRQDISEHPFTTSFNRFDVRITTRIDENDFKNMTWSCIHEGGHGLYEQGLPESEYGLPSGEATSLGMHESQSRLWENNVGRSIEYWQYHYPVLQQRFPAQFKAVSMHDFYKAINTVQPSLIRTEADELTYHLHVIIRYEIEKKIINESVEVKELPALWNQLYHDYLDIKVPDDLKGILQDVHWSHGSFGYFPTYSLGSLYASQFFASALNNNPGLPDQISQGETSVLLQWLRKNIHQYGRVFTSAELCQRISGESLNANYFMEYARQKYGEIYGL